MSYRQITINLIGVAQTVQRSFNGLILRGYPAKQFPDVAGSVMDSIGVPEESDDFSRDELRESFRLATADEFLTQVEGVVCERAETRLAERA